jgi:hypothetical protein
MEETPPTADIPGASGTSNISGTLATSGVLAMEEMPPTAVIPGASGTNNIREIL